MKNVSFLPLKSAKIVAIQWIRACCWMLIRLLATLRYRVRVEGLKELRDLRGPTLVMPNHPGLIDPVLVLSHVRIPGGLRPIVTRHMYRRSFLYPFMRLADAVEVPDLTEQSRDARQQTLSMIDAVAAGLSRGENFLLYPAGRIERGGIEEIGGTRAVADLLKRCPHVNVVLVRTRGIWGSIFTIAYTGGQPKLGRCIVKALGWGLAALVIFLPRRKVTITVERIEHADLRGITREKLNSFLDGWYNYGGPEKPVFVPFSVLFGPQQHKYPQLVTVSRFDPANIQSATIRAVNDMVQERVGWPLAAEGDLPETRLERLGLDSLDRMDLTMQIEDHFGFRSDHVADTLGELWALAEGQLSISGDTPRPATVAWVSPTSNDEEPGLLGETLAEAFLRRVWDSPNDVAAADHVSGVLTYRELFVGVSLMAKRLRKLASVAMPHDTSSPALSLAKAKESQNVPDEVGVLLPGSVAADTVFFALHLAGKLPVMLNWTTGPAQLAYAVKTLRLRTVITSKRLIDRLDIRIEEVEYLFVEDIGADIGKLEAAITLASTYLLPNRMPRDLPLPDIDAPAVILFTSGSESSPKTVPLSHRNLTSNLRASLAAMQLTRRDSLLGFLPPFHSFGLLVNMLVPILAGIRVAHYPDPTDATGLVRTVATYKTTVMVTTPTFLTYVFAAATPEDLASLRIIVSGAERFPETLFERAKHIAPQAVVVEGYGITECSPVVAVNRPGKTKLGTVGPPVPGVEVCLVDPNSRQRLYAGATGMLLVRGASVFKGYLNYNGPEPFVDVDGKRWYVTGDIVSLDEDSYIRFYGRLKRFLKIAGEMVSLPAIEEPLSQLYPPTEDGPQVAVEGVDSPHRWIMLFTVQGISLMQANDILVKAGLRGVMRLDAVQQIEKIPVLGTGKTDYRMLREVVAEQA